MVGVAHVLPKSKVEAERVIKRERPEVVALELCPTRYAVLMAGVKPPGRFKIEPFTLEGLLYLLQRRFSSRAGMPAGEEMLGAARSAQEVGARLELIDRDINVTLKRLMDQMGWREKLRLFLELCLGFFPWGGRFNLERLTEEEVVAELLASFRRALPTAYRVLIEERNSYMAQRLSSLLVKHEGKVVGVVGAGHVPGLASMLELALRGGWRLNLEFTAHF